MYPGRPADCRGVQGRPPVVVACPDVRAGIEQGSDVRQQAGSVFRFLIRADSFRLHVGDPFLGRNVIYDDSVQRCPSEIVSRADVGPGLDERPNVFRPAAPRGGMERRAAMLVPRINVHAGIEQDCDARQRKVGIFKSDVRADSDSASVERRPGSIRHRAMEGRPAGLISRAGLCARIEKSRDMLRSPRTRCRVQRCPTSGPFGKAAAPFNAPRNVSGRCMQEEGVLVPSRAICRDRLRRSGRPRFQFRPDPISRSLLRFSFVDCCWIRASFEESIPVFRLTPLRCFAQRRPAVGIPALKFRAGYNEGRNRSRIPRPRRFVKR